MIIELHRVQGRQTPFSTGGLLVFDGVSKFTSLEPPAGPELIPAQTYHVIKQWSPRFQRLTPHLQNVPGHTFIEMHMGNFPRDTHGCVLIGQTWSTDYVGLSDVSFDAFMAMTPDEFDLSILETA